jgi:Glutaredoxin
MATLTVYEKPTCTTCRKPRALLVEHGVEHESIDYHETGLKEDELRGLLGKLGCGPREVLRTREPLAEELGGEMGRGVRRRADRVAGVEPCAAATPDRGARASRCARTPDRAGT